MGVLLCHCEMDDATQAKARAALRREIKRNPKFKTDDLDADCVIEQVWNALSGFDEVKPPDEANK